MDSVTGIVGCWNYGCRGVGGITELAEGRVRGATSTESGMGIVGLQDNGPVLHTSSDRAINQHLRHGLREVLIIGNLLLQMANMDSRACLSRTNRSSALQAPH